MMMMDKTRMLGGGERERGAHTQVTVVMKLVMMMMMRPP